MSTESENLQTVRRYLAAIEQGVSFEELAEFFTPDVVQIEYPNRLVVDGARRSGTTTVSNRSRDSQKESA